MSVLDQVFHDKQGGDLLFSAGVEVGRTKGREEFADHLIRQFRKLSQGQPLSFADFVRREMVIFQREHS